jgi:hypothetical protein
MRRLIEAPSESLKNPFQCDEFTSSDVEEAYPTMVTMQLLDSDHEALIFCKQWKTFRRQNWAFSDKDI